MVEHKPERVACVKPGCTGTLNPILVNSYNGYCIKCITAVEKAAKDEYIRQNRKDFNPYEGISDPVELLLIKYKYNSFHDPLVNLLPCPWSEYGLIADMTAKQLEQLETKVSSMLSSRNEELKELARRTICFMVFLTDYDLDNVLLKLINDIDDYDGFIFRRAGVKVQEALFKLLAKGDKVGLACLAWNNSSAVFQRLIRLKEHPPDNFPDFSESFDNFAAYAGWEVTSDNKRRDLFYQSSREMVLVEEVPANAFILKSYLDAHERCPWCKGPLVYLANIESSLLKSMLGVNLSFSHLPFYSCAQCMCGVNWLFCELEADGKPKWSDFNKYSYGSPEMAESLTFESLPEKELSFAISSELRPPLLYSCGVEPEEYRPNSQFGGAPSWLQGAEYPCCPKCQLRMKFLFQIDAEGHDIYDWGVYYAFYCEKCQSYTATMRQCT